MNEPSAVRETSKAAYASIADKLPAKRRTVMELFWTHSQGLTLFEVQKLINKPVNQLSGRITELTKENLLKDSGHRRVNPETGKSAIVWILA